VHAELKAKGVHCGRKRVERLMREDGLRARKKRRFRATTDSTHAHPIAPNHLARHFEVEAVEGVDQVWVGDITYVPTREGWLYLAVVLDLKSRAVVGWAMKNTLETSLATDALTMALWRRRPGRGLMHHSDRGVQPRFNWSSQHCLFEPIVGTHPTPRPVFSSPESFVAGC
jgi:transposase InsO family protein